MAVRTCRGGPSAARPIIKTLRTLAPPPGLGGLKRLELRPSGDRRLQRGRPIAKGHVDPASQRRRKGRGERFGGPGGGWQEVIGVHRVELVVHRTQ